MVLQGQGSLSLSPASCSAALCPAAAPGLHGWDPDATCWTPVPSPSPAQPSLGVCILNWDKNGQYQRAGFKPELLQGVNGHLALGEDVLEPGQRDVARIPSPNSSSSTVAFTLLQRCTNKSLPRAQHCQKQALGQQISLGKLRNRLWDWARRAGNKSRI